jgi:hypothetical protein
MGWTIIGSTLGPKFGQKTGNVSAGKVWPVRDGSKLSS